MLDFLGDWLDGIDTADHAGLVELQPTRVPLVAILRGEILSDRTF